MARPTKYRPEMCEQLIALMTDGASKAEVAHELGISRETMVEWAKSNQEFSDALKEGEAASEAWWLKKGRVNLENKEFNYTGWYMNMKNRHGWKDKTDVTSNDKELVGFTVKNAD